VSLSMLGKLSSIESFLHPPPKLFDIGSHNVAQAGLELIILLSVSTGSWDCRHVTACLVWATYF
jgi:hypothetical protein